MAVPVVAVLVRPVQPILVLRAIALVAGVAAGPARAPTLTELAILSGPSEVALRSHGIVAAALVGTAVLVGTAIAACASAAVRGRRSRGDRRLGRLLGAWRQAQHPGQDVLEMRESFQ